MKRFWTFAVIALLVGTTCAQSADLAARPYAKAPPMVAAAAFSWTGCYVGGNIGGVRDRADNDLTMAGDFLLPDNIFRFAENRALLSHSYTTNGSGVTGGVQVGCNYQTGALVWGAEADFNYAGLHETVFASYDRVGCPFFGAGNGCASPHTETVKNDLDWFSTFRGRLGYTWDRLLLYGTGGLAVGQIRSSTNVAFGNQEFIINGVTFAGSDSRIRAGWALGAGAEWALGSNWSIKAEYLHLDFGSFNYLSSCTPVAICRGGGGIPVGESGSWLTSVRARDDVFRLGVNYRFGLGGPVIARY